MLQDKGVLLILRRVELEGVYIYYALEIIMNPMRLLDEGDYFQLTEENHVELLETAFYKVLKPIRKEFSIRSKLFSNFRLDKLDNYGFKRVDFAVNIYTEHILFYMELIKRANIPAGYELFQIFSKTSKRNIQPMAFIFLNERKVSRNRYLASP